MNSQKSSVIEFRILGIPALYRGGERIRLYSAKVWALITYLALHPNQIHNREWLSSLLWGETPDKKARASLRQALYSIKQVVGEKTKDLLHIDKESVTFFAIDSVQIDVVELMSAFQQEDYQQVVDSYGGMLLEGLRLSDCPEYESWLYLQRDTIQQKVIISIQQLVTNLLKVGAYDMALPYAQQLTDIDILNEDSHCLLMQIHANKGDLSAARHQYQICVDVLERELGVDPMPETTNFFQQLGQDQLPDVRSSTPVIDKVETISDFPLMERDDELKILTQAWHNIVSQPDNLLFIRGEAGVGKSRLVQEFIEKQGIHHCLIGRCFEVEAHTPFAMWSDMLQPLTQPQWHTQIASLESIWYQQVALIVPTLTSEPITEMDSATHEEKRLRLLQGIVRCLAQLAQSPLLLVFEDLHWADETSLELLHYAARRLSDMPILFVATFHPESSYQHLMQLVRSTADSTRMIQLEALSKDITHHLLTHMPDSIPADLTQDLYQFSKGNPFVLIETLRALRDRTVQQDPAMTDTALPVSERVRQLVLGRLSSLDEAQRRILETAALIGRPFILPLLRHVSGMSETRLLEDLDTLFLRGFLQDYPASDTLDLAHDYTRQVIINHLRLPRKLALHRRIAETLITMPRANPKEIAFHFMGAGDERAVAYYVEAAKQAETLFALVDATQSYQQALSLVQTTAPNNYQQQFELCLLLEAIFNQQGNRVAQADIITQLIDLAQQLDDPSALATVYVRQAGLLTYLTDYEQAHQVLNRALEQYRDLNDLSGEANALCEMGFLQWTNEQYSPALAYNRNALQLYRREGNVQGQAMALHNLAEIFRGLGSIRQAIEFYRQAEELYWSLQDLNRLEITLYGAAHAHRALDKTELARHYYEQALEHCVKSGNRLMQSRVYHSLATLQWEHDEAQSALEYLDQAVYISREIGHCIGIAHSLWLRSVYYSHLNNLKLSHSSINEAIEWLHMAEDTIHLANAQTWMTALNNGETKAIEPPTSMYWIRTHFNVGEGKVYCEFESPAAQAKQPLSSA